MNGGTENESVSTTDSGQDRHIGKYNDDDEDDDYKGERVYSNVMIATPSEFMASPPVDSVQQMIADNIRERRQYLRFTQQEVADALNIKRNTYAAYEKAVNSVASKDMVKIARVLNCTVAYLYGEESENIRPINERSDHADSIIASMMRRFWLTMHPTTRAFTLRLLIERFLSDLIAPDQSGRFPRGQLMQYGQGYSVTDFIRHLETAETKK